MRRLRRRGRRLRLTPIEQAVNSRAKPGETPGFVVLVAPSGSYRVAAYIRAARALGRPLMVVSNSGHSLVPDIANGITVDFDNPAQACEKILSAIGTRKVGCVLATDDSSAELAGRVAGRLGLPRNSAGAARLTRRKDLARAALRQAGCNAPAFQVVRISEAAQTRLEIGFPVVVKPLGLAASRGVIRADSRDALLDACRRIDPILDAAGQTGVARDHVLVEAYIDGPEFAVEGFMIDGEFKLLAVFDKPEPLSGPFFEETYYLTPSRLPADRCEALVDEVERCCRAYGLEHGPVHAEIRLGAEGPTLVELAARTIGGQCGQLIEFSLGQKLEELVIQGMCGALPKPERRAESAGVLMIPIRSAGILHRVEGLTAAMQTRYIEDIEIHISPGYELTPLPEGASYLGFIFARGPDFERTYDALRSAHHQLRFVTRPKWAIETLAV